MNPATKCDDWLFRADACAITLAYGDESIACNADIRTGLDGRTLVSIHRQDETAVSLRVRSAFGARGKRTATPLSLRGTTPLGSLETDRAYLTNVQMGSRRGVPPYWEAQLDVPGWWLNRPFWTASLALPRTGFSLTYRVVGVRGFGLQDVETPIGKLTFNANPHRSESPQVTGLLQVMASDGEQRVEEWIGDCEALIRRVLDIVGLVLGHRVSWCLRVLGRSDEGQTAAEFTSPGPIGVARDGLWSHLDLQRWVDLGALAYTPELEEERGLGLVIGYLLADAPYSETRHVLAATALEVLIGAYERSTTGESTLLPKSVYETEILPGLLAAVDAVPVPPSASPTVARALQIYRNKLQGLNSLPLEQRLYRMLDDYSVPYTGLESEIRAGMRARNDVAHRGVGRPDADLLRHTAVLREVALRTILTLLGYAGRYYSHVNGEEERVFPPTGATSIRPA